MLSLHCATPPRWLDQVSGNLPELLLDHAHCEKKAAGVAMNLLFSYVENQTLCREMTEIVQEELAHFHQVLAILNQRGIPFRRIKPSQYGARLHEAVDKQEPRRAVDRLLVAGLIEARSCERFAVLRDHLPDAELARFFGGLFESEARHHSAYVRLAKDFASEDEVRSRLHVLAELEAQLILTGEALPRMHS